jgi:Na+/melibiose symporter-like transporter
VFFAFAAGASTAPLAGLVVDRVRRKPLLVAANLASAVGVCALLLVHSEHQIWLIYLVMFGYGGMNALITSAQTALVPALVPAELLGEANSALQIGSQGLRIFTPLIGAGLLAAVGAAPVIGLDAGTFAVAAACTAALAVREQRPARQGSPGGPTALDPPGQPARWRAEVTAGFSYAWGSPVLRRLLVACVLALTVVGFMETIGFAVVDQGLHKTPPFLGVLVAVQAGGAIGGAVACAPVMKKFGGAALLFGTGVLGVVIGACVLFGVSIVWANIAATTLIQRHTPASLLGRVDSAVNLACTGPQAVSIAVGALLIGIVGYHVLLIAIAVMMAVTVGYLLTGRTTAQAGQAAAGDDDSEPVTAEVRG